MKENQGETEDIQAMESFEKITRPTSHPRAQEFEWHDKITAEIAKMVQKESFQRAVEKGDARVETNNDGSIALIEIKGPSGDIIYYTNINALRRIANELPPEADPEAPVH